MYVEIAPRQTGKTTRLIEKLAVEVLKGHTIALVAPTKTIANSIKHKILIQHPEIDPTKILTSHKMLTGLINFVDEFDWIDEKNLFIDDYSYYATSLQNELGTLFTRCLYSQYKSQPELSEFERIVINIKNEIDNG